MSLTNTVSGLFSGANTRLKPKFCAVFTRCLSLLTGRISPARLISPARAVASGQGRSVLAE